MKIISQRDRLTTCIAFLRMVPLFAGLSDADLESLMADFAPLEYDKGESLFLQGEVSSELYLLRRGKVRIYKASAQGRETSINIFSTGHVFGEFAALDRLPRSATALAITRCVVWRMDSAAFVRNLRNLPDLSLALNRLLVAKLRWTAEFAETVAQYDAAGRLLHLLLLYTDEFGEVLEADKRYELDLGLTQGDLASLAGASRTWVNRLLQSWQREGWMEYRAGKLVIHDLARMRQERDRNMEGEQES